VIRRLFRPGRTLAVGLPQAVVEAAGWHEGETVLVEHDAATGAGLLWPAAVAAQVRTRSAEHEAISAFLAAYGDALRALEALDRAAGE